MPKQSNNKAAVGKEWLADWKKKNLAGRYDADRGVVRVVLESSVGMVEIYNGIGIVCRAPVYVIRGGDGVIPPGFRFVARIVGRCYVAKYDCGFVDGSKRAADGLRSPEVWIGPAGAMLFFELVED